MLALDALPFSLSLGVMAQAGFAELSDTTPRAECLIALSAVPWY
jgi:hypothetical protein